MKKTVSFYDFQDAFEKTERSDQFTYDGLKALYDFLCELEDNTGEDIELDVIAICCDFTEYESLKEFQGDYGEEYQALEDIENETTVIRIPNSEGFIIQDF